MVYDKSYIYFKKGDVIINVLPNPRNNFDQMESNPYLATQ